MKHAKQWITILLGGLMMLSLFGCSKPKYKLQFEGFGFQTEKTEYAEGETVTVYYNLIATDTDYRFWLDSEDVELSQDFDGSHGYVFTFSMPAHDVTLHMSSRNSMVFVPRRVVTVVNEVEEADVWILPQTEENLKRSVWGTASVGKLGVGETAELELEGSDSSAWIVRIIDADHAYYSVQDLTLEDGYRIVFQSADSKFDAVIQLQDESGAVLSTSEAFVGVLGAE